METIILTDDFKIMLKKTIQALKCKKKQGFIHCGKYILKELEIREFEVFLNFLYELLEKES